MDDLIIHQKILQHSHFKCGKQYAFHGQHAYATLLFQQRLAHLEKSAGVLEIDVNYL